MSLFTWAILYVIHTMMSNVYDNTLIFWGVERHFFAFISWGATVIQLLNIHTYYLIQVDIHTTTRLLIAGGEPEGLERKGPLINTVSKY